MSRAYVPPRQQWAQPEPLQQQRQQTTSPLANVENIRASPQPSGLVSGPRHKRAPSESYYEDVDPRFAVEEPSDDGYQRDSALPTALTPGGHINPDGTTPGVLAGSIPGNFPASPGASQANSGYGFPNRTQPPSHDPEYLHPSYGGAANDGHSSGDNSSLEQEHEHRSSGGGSERASETSHFTSISDRPINPMWRPGSVQGGFSPSPRPAPAPAPRREDLNLNANPDFSIPGVGLGRGGRARAGSRGAATGQGIAGAGLTPMGRYPTDL